MSTPAIEPAPLAPPGAAASAAKPISPAELSQALSAPKPASALPPGTTPPVAPPVPDQKPSPQRPDFKSALRDRVKGGEKPEPGRENVAPKPVDAPPPEPQKKVVSFEAAVKKKEAAATEAAAKDAKTKETVSADDAPPPAKAATTPTGDEVPEDQRRVLPHDKPDTAKRIKAILAERDAAKAAVDAAKKELEDARKAGASSEEIKKLKDEHEALRQDALRLRRLHDLKSDKEFNEKYDAPVKQVDSAIAETLKRYQFGEATLKAIEAEGGFAAFSRSQKQFSITEPDPENPGETRKVLKTAAQLSREWLAGMDVADSEAIKASLGKQQLLQSEKAAAIEKAQAEAREYFENKDKSSREQAEAARLAQEKTMKEYTEWRDKTLAETEFLRDREIPVDATPEQKAAVEEYNKFTAQLRDRIAKDPTNAVEYGQLKLEAAESHHLRRTLGEKDAEIARLQEQLKQKSAALRTTPKAGSILKGNGAPPAAKQDVSDPMGSFKDNLRRRMQAGSADE